ncbi:MAG: methanol dehydrogenase, partial [Treponema sp.]|nr:methanol dehydrogenase [Treponema sp.]
MKNKIFLFLGIIFIFNTIFAFSLDVPQLTNPVNDLANIMESSEVQSLNEKLLNLNSQFGIQFAVLTIPTLEEEILEEYSLRVAETWALGQKKEDNGALLLVAFEERKIRIEVGYGLEGKLTDLMCGRIIREVIAPKFSEGSYGEGIIGAIDNMIGLATDNAELVDEYVSNARESDNSDLLISIIPILIFFIIVFFASKYGKNGGGSYSSYSGGSS